MKLMRYVSINFLRKRKLREYGLFFFLLGIFFLASSLFIGIIFLLPSAIIGSWINKKPYFKDKWNYPFIIFGFLISTSALLQNFILSNNYSEIWDPILSIIGIGNWLPFIWFFWAFQPYLDSKAKRRYLALTLIAGTFPVLITGLGQYYFNWTGPFQTLNGLIIWYQRPIGNPGGLSGLFNNQNYAGSWLNLIWPFCIALILEKRKNIQKKIISFFFLFSVGFAGFLTYSRNAWLGLILSLPIMFGKKALKIILPIIAFVLLIILFTFNPLFTGEIQDYFRKLIPEKFLLEFVSEGYVNLDVSRKEIFTSAIDLIKMNPFFGIGAASFPNIYFLETGFWKGHTHNLLFELSLSYGLPSSIIFFIIITFIVILSGKEVFFKKRIDDTNLFDRAIWTALLFFLISQLADIQYFDGKISLIAWILISSLKNIIEEVNDRNVITS